MTELKEFKQGYHAFFNREPRVDNPYDFPTLHNFDWDDGWRRARDSEETIRGMKIL